MIVRKRPATTQVSEIINYKIHIIANWYFARTICVVVDICLTTVVCAYIVDQNYIG